MLKALFQITGKVLEVICSILFFMPPPTPPLRDFCWSLYHLQLLSVTILSFTHEKVDITPDWHFSLTLHPFEDSYFLKYSRKNKLLPQIIKLLEALKILWRVKPKKCGAHLFL